MSTMFFLITLAVLVGSLLIYLTTRRPVCTGKRAGKVRPPIEQVLLNPELVKYEVKDLSTPVLVGYRLWLLVQVAYMYIGFIINNSIVRKSNLDLLNGEYIPESPTLYPAAPVQYTLPAAVLDRGKVNRLVLQDIAYRYTGGRCEHRYTSLDYYQSYKSAKCTPSDVARAVLNAVAHSNQRTPPLRAVIETDETYTMKLADASTERWRQGKPLSLLDGVPFAVKAEIKFESYSLTAGGTFTPTCASGTIEALVVRKLVDAGAVMIGLTNLQEFGTGTLGSNPHKDYQTPRNPYNDSYYCGGSSSGSAACVAAGLCPIALGGDAGGSIRIPASFCGVTGLKPTFRLVDSTGFLPQTCSVGVMGPMCASNIDTAIAMSIMCADAIDLEQMRQDDLNGVKIGIYKEYFEHADPEIVTQCRKAIDVMVSLGAEVKDIVIPELEEVRVAHAVTTCSEFFANYAVDIYRSFDKINKESLTLFRIGMNVTSKEYINAQKQRTRSIKVLEAIFKEVDIIATPCTAIVAPVIPAGADQFGYGDGEKTALAMRFAALANLTGIPGVSVPVGLTANGHLPIGLQLQSHWNSEGELIRVAYALEKQVSSLVTRPSSIYYDILKTV